MDQAYRHKFKNEERTGELTSIFTALTLEMFGLASFVAEQRTKEIGVRKVLGASVLNVWALLIQDFVSLVCVVHFLSMPLAWYALTSWLQQYTYRITMPW